MNDQQYKGVILVTGANSGIGYALTNRLLLEGYAVSATDVIVDKLECISHPLLTVYNLDVRNKIGLEQVVHDTVIRLGRIDGLCSCAAIFPAMPFLEISESIWNQTMDINLKGTFFASQSVIPVMRKQGYGSIVLFSSMIARSGGIRAAHYAASKGGILGLTRSLALELAKDRIRVNSVSPGITDTPQPRGNMSEEEIYNKGKHIPLGRIAVVDDIVGPILFLLEEESSYLTGQDLRIDGGALMF